MIGNDVVDLNLAATESNWRRRGFLDKLFTSDEQRLIETSSDHDLTLWTMWSRKEAVYKIINRLSGLRAFIPLRITCDNDGYCSYGSQKFFTRTSVQGSGLFTTAACNENDFEKIRLASRKHVVKDGSLPFVRSYPASVSHHGEFEQVVYLQLEP